MYSQKKYFLLVLFLIGLTSCSEKKEPMFKLLDVSKTKIDFENTITETDDFNILTKGVNEDNANLLVREDFSNPMILNNNNRYEPILIYNAPNGNLDKILDNESNETITFNNPPSNTISEPVIHLEESLNR